MDPHSPDSRAYDQILQDHLALQTLLQRIDGALAGQTVAIAEVRGLLSQLSDGLVKHFALEETSGYFSEALIRAPRLAARAGELMAQHPKICEQARDLPDLSTGQDSERWRLETRQRFQAFKTELQKHEHDEDLLLLEAYTQK